MVGYGYFLELPNTPSLLHAMETGISYGSNGPLGS